MKAPGKKIKAPFGAFFLLQNYPVSEQKLF